MLRYFIDTDDNDTVVIDDVGADLPDAAAARELALRSLQEMATDRIPIGDHDRRTFCARVRDEYGTVIYAGELSLTGEWVVPPPVKLRLVN